MDQNLGTTIMQILPLLLLITVVIVVSVLPQRKREKQVKQMIDEMKKGDWVRTIGGIVGKVYMIKGENVVLETGPDKVKVTFTRGAIATVGEAEVEAEGLSETDIKLATKDGKGNKK